jgi:hypothetical protein
METSANPNIGPYQSDHMHNCERSEAEANEVGPRRHDCHERKREEPKRVDETMSLV